MASVVRNWLSPTLIVAAGMASAIARDRLPVLVDLRFDGLLPFPISEPSGAAPRWVALWAMPALALALWIAFSLATTERGQRIGRRLFRQAPEEVTSPAQFERFGRSYDTIVVGVVLLVLGVHAGLLLTAFQQPSIGGRIIIAVLGASLVLMGNVMPRLRPNWIAGLRTRRLLENPQLWRRVHRTFGTAFVLAGLVTIGAALFAPRYGILVGMAGVIVSCLVGFAASLRTAGASAHPALSLAVTAMLCAAANTTSAQAPPTAIDPTALHAPATVAESPVHFSQSRLTLHAQ